MFTVHHNILESSLTCKLTVPFFYYPFAVTTFLKDRGKKSAGICQVIPVWLPALQLKS